MNLNEILKDCRNENLPKNFDNFNKLKIKELTNGLRINWYYKEDKRMAKENGYDPKDNVVYNGIIMAIPDTEYNGSLEEEDCIVVIDRYPCEKCYPLVDWIALNRLLDNEDLVEVY